jgi:hypothetical protein
MKKWMVFWMAAATASIAYADENGQWSCNRVRLPTTECLKIIGEGDLITVESDEVIRFCDFDKQIVHLYNYKDTDKKVFACALKKILTVGDSSRKKDAYEGVRWWDWPILIEIESRKK